MVIDIHDISNGASCTPVLLIFIFKQLPMMSGVSQKPRHPKANLYFQRKLFDGISRFAELEHRITGLPTKQERGDAFEVFTEAYLSTQRLHQAKTVWPISMLPMTIKDRFALRQNDVGVD